MRSSLFRWWSVPFLFFAMVVASRAAPAESQPRKYHIGFRLLRVRRENQPSLTVALWYPTRAQARFTKYVPVFPHLEGEVARNAAPAKGPFPLVVFSHGGIGAGVCAMSWAEGLAEQGFVVAAPDHHDSVVLLRSDAERPPSGLEVIRALQWATHLSRDKEVRQIDASEYQHRPAEIRATIDYLLDTSADAESPLHGLVDGNRIGLTGVSFGAWTTLAVSGGIPLYRDQRIKAAVPMAPPVGKIATERIAVPIMFIFGEKETIVLLDRSPNAALKENRLLADYRQAHPPKFLVGIREAEHLDFDADGLTTRGGRRRREATGRKVYRTSDVRRDDPVIRTILRFQSAFWKRYLLGDRNAESFLKHPDEPAVYLYRNAIRSTP